MIGPLPVAEIDFGKVTVWARSECPSAEDAIRADAEWGGSDVWMDGPTLRIVWTTEWMGGDWLSGQDDPHADSFAVFGGQPMLTECWELTW